MFFWVWLRVLVCCSLVVQRFLRASVFSLLLEGLFWRGLKWKNVNILRWLMRALFANVFMIFFGSFILKWWFWIVVGAGVGCGVIIVLYLLSIIVSGSTRIFSKPLLLSGRSVLFATGWGVGLQEVLLRMKTSFSNARVKISRSR